MICEYNYNNVYTKQRSKCYKIADEVYVPIDEVMDDFDRYTLKTDCSDNRPKSSNELINDKLKKCGDLEPYSNTFKKEQVPWFPVYIQIGMDENLADYYVLKDIRNDYHQAIYYKISGEYAFTLSYAGCTYMRETFTEYGSYVPCYVLPCTAKDILEHNSTCKLEDTALLLKEIWADVKKYDPSAIEQTIIFENGYYYHTEHYMKNKFIHFDF